MPLPPQNVRQAQEKRRTIQENYEAFQRRKAGIPQQIIVPDETGTPKEWTRLDQGEYWLITDPDGNTYRVLKEDDFGARMEDFIDDHLTWGTLFKLGLIGLGFAMFAGGVRISREVANGKKKN